MQMSYLTRLGVTISVLITSCFISVVPVSAQTDAADDAKRRINLAGRQRMFSQRMSKAACFILTGVEVEKHEKMLQKTYDLFAVTNDALSNGSDTLELKPERNPAVFVALTRVQKRWDDFAPKVRAVIDHATIDTGSLAELDASGLALLKDMNTAVNIIAKTYGDQLPELPLILAVTIDLAGRQRMFTQKMSKDFCLIDAGVEPDANRADLEATAQYFTATLDALIDGFPGAVMAAPNDDIHAKLLEVKELWKEPAAVLQAAASGGPISEADRLLIADQMEEVLVTMNEAVKLYEFVDGTERR